MKNFLKTLNKGGFVDFEGAKYRFNMDKIFSLFNTDNTEREITDAYDIDGDINANAQSKIVREITNYDISNRDSLKYDFLKTLILTVIEGPVLYDEAERPYSFTFGMTIAFNTLINEEILIKIEE